MSALSRTVALRKDGSESEAGAFRGETRPHKALKHSEWRKGTRNKTIDVGGRGRHQNQLALTEGCEKGMTQSFPRKKRGKKLDSVLICSAQQDQRGPTTTNP